MTSANIVEVTDQAGFDREVLNSKTPVLVDFWAEWCGPCRMVAPVLEELATDLDGQVTIAKVDVDSPELQPVAMKFQVSSIPTFILFKDGQVADRMMGAMPKGAFEQFIGRHV
ncbi:MAG: thioredoxin [Acidobacteriota bacterium]|nr:thioredoxin [Acidobacteriota bacterium]MDH3525230.1 thioredoxin [Acidobacteriota bacterium]